MSRAMILPALASLALLPAACAGAWYERAGFEDESATRSSRAYERLAEVLTSNDADPPVKAAACGAISAIRPRSFAELEPLASALAQGARRYDEETQRTATLIATQYEPGVENEQNTSLEAHFKDRVDIGAACVAVAFFKHARSFCRDGNARSCLLVAKHDLTLTGDHRAAAEEKACSRPDLASDPLCVRRQQRREETAQAVPKRTRGKPSEPPDPETEDFKKLDIESCRSGPRSVESCIAECRTRVARCMNEHECESFRSPGFHGGLTIPPCEAVCPELNVHQACAPLREFLRQYPNSKRAAELQAVLAGEDDRAAAEGEARRKARLEAERQRAEQERLAREQEKKAKAAAQVCYQACMRACTKRYGPSHCVPYCMEGCTVFQNGMVVTP